MRWKQTKYSASLAGRRQRNTAPELALRCALRQAGFAYRLHPQIGPRLRGDIYVPRANTIIFVDGCFWHQCPAHRWDPRRCQNAELWRRKFEATRLRDDRAVKDAVTLGYNAVRVFECEVRRDSTAVLTNIRELADSLCRIRSVSATGTETRERASEPTESTRRRVRRPARHAQGETTISAKPDPSLRRA